MKLGSLPRPETLCFIYRKIGRAFFLQIVCSGDIPEDRILRILESKKSTCGIIVYAKNSSLEKEKMQEINRSHHVSVVNMRGRLANEVIVMLLATSFTRKDALSR